MARDHQPAGHRLTGTRDTRGVGQYKAVGLDYQTGYWGPYGMPMVEVEFQTAPSIFSLERNAVLTTQLYETRGAALVYSIESNVKTQESRDIILAQLTPMITSQLKAAGLIP